MENHLFIGLGGFGGKALAEIKKCEFLNQKVVEIQKNKPRIGYLYVDSSADVQKSPRWKILGEDISLNPSDVINLKDNVMDLNAVDGLPHIRSWIGSQESIQKYLRGAGEGVPGANQRRRFGRFLFASNVPVFLQKLKNKVDSLGGKAEHTFHIFATFAGGTGSGALIDVVTTIRKAYPNSEKYPIFVYGFTTDRIKDNPANPHFFFANQYAVIRDLNNLMVGDYLPQDLTEISETKVPNHKYINTVYLITPQNKEDVKFEPDNQVKIVGSWVYQKVMSEVFNHIDETTLKSFTGEDIFGGGYDAEPDEKGNNARSLRFGSIGLQRWTIPEEQAKEALRFDYLEQAFEQMLNNNWDNQYGYQDSPAVNTLDFSEMKSILSITSDEQWILSETQKFPTFKKEWERAAEDVNLHDGLSGSVKNLARHLDDYKLRKFRESGTKGYFHARMQGIDRGDSEELSRELSVWVNRQWQEGKMGLSEIQESLNKLKDGLVIHGKDFRSSGKLDSAPSIDSLERKWISHADKIGWLSKNLNAEKRMFERCKREMIDACVADSMEFGKLYAADLAEALIDEITELVAALEQTKDVINTTLETVKSDRKPLLSNFDVSDNDKFAQDIVEFDQDAYNQIWQAMRKDRGRMDDLIRECRKGLLDGENLVTLYAVGREAIYDKVVKIAETKVKGGHDNVCQERTLVGKDVLGRNIWEVFSKNWNSVYKARVKRFLESAVTLASRSGDPDPAQYDEALSQTGEPIPRERIMLLNPLTEGDQNRKELHKKFEDQNYRGQLVFSDHDNPYELVCLSIECVLPARCLEIVHQLHRHYEKGMSNDQKYRYFCHLDSESEDQENRPKVLMPHSQP